MRIVAVQPSTKKDLLSFITFPLDLYSHSRYYVPHLIFERKSFFNPRKNPFFTHADVAYYLARSKEGKVLGRISAHIDWNYVRYHSEETGFFGFFDCIEDPGIASALLEAASSYLRKKGMRKILGPLNFSMSDEAGVLVKGFDSVPFIMMPYNYPYYGGYIEQCGFGKAKDLFAYYTEYGGETPESILRVSKRVRMKSGVYLRTLEMKNFYSELKLIGEIYNSAWEKNWGFVPMTEKEIAFLANNLRQIVDPSLIIFAFVGEQPVGFLVALPDYNLILKDLRGRLFPFGFLKAITRKNKIDRIRVFVLGVVEEFRRMGFESVMLEEIYRVGPQRGYGKGEMSWILEDNDKMNRIISRIVDKPYKIYRIYGKEL